MTKTSNYNLNKPEVTDPMRLADFNENSDKIDGALNSVRNEAVNLSAQVRAEAANALAAYKTSNDAAVSTKADKTALTAYQASNDAAVAALNTAVESLNTAAAGFGNCHIASGTYKGTGKYGSANPTTIEVGFAPKLAIIYFEHSGDQHCHLFVWPLLVFDLGDSFTSETTTMIWGDKHFGFYCSSAYSQMNDTRFTYSYIVIG